MNLIKSSNTTIRMSDAPQGQGACWGIYFWGTRLKCVYDENTYKVAQGTQTQTQTQIEMEMGIYGWTCIRFELCGHVFVFVFN